MTKKCADITLVADAVGPASDVCVNTTQSSIVVGDASWTTSSNTTNTTSGGATSSSGTSDATGTTANIAALLGFSVMAVCFSVGMSL